MRCQLVSDKKTRWLHLKTGAVYFEEPSLTIRHLFLKEVKHKGCWVDPAEKLLWILKQPAWAGGVFTTQDGKLLYRKGSAVLTINDELEQRIRDMTTDTDSKG